MKTHFWPIYIIMLSWLLAGCTNVHYNHYFPLEDETVKPRKVNVINHSDQVVWSALEINNIESSSKDFMEMPPGYSYQLPAPAKAKVTLVVRYFDEHNFKVQKRDAIFTRQTLQSDQQLVEIKNATLYGRVSESWMVHNTTNQTIVVSTDKKDKFFTLAPGEGKEVSDFLSDETVTFYWEALNYPRRDKMRYQYTPNPNKLSYYDGHWYGAVITIERY